MRQIRIITHLVTQKKSRTKQRNLKFILMLLVTRLNHFRLIYFAGKLGTLFSYEDRQHDKYMSSGNILLPIYARVADVLCLFHQSKNINGM